MGEGRRMSLGSSSSLFLRTQGEPMKTVVIDATGTRELLPNEPVSDAEKQLGVVTNTFYRASDGVVVSTNREGAHHSRGTLNSMGYNDEERAYCVEAYPQTANILNTLFNDKDRLTATTKWLRSSIRAQRNGDRPINRVEE
jgi:hypothetical protein